MYVLNTILLQKLALFHYFLLRSSANFFPNARHRSDSERYGNATNEIDDGDQLAEGGEAEGRSHLEVILQK